MKIKSIHIKNFKGFKERTFNFEGNFTLLIGDNGTGKTSILESLSVGLGGFLAGLDGVNSRNILPDEVRKETQLYGDATFTTEPQFPVIISCIAEINHEQFQWNRTLNLPKGNTTRRGASNIIKYARSLQNKIQKEKDQNVVLPVMGYYSAARMWSQKRKKWIDPFEKEDVSRFLGYTDCLDLESNNKFFVRWFRRMTLIQLQKKKKIGELDAVLEAIQTCFKGIHNEQDVNITYDFEEQEVMVEIGNERVPLRMMSAGYRSMIGMVADLAYRMALLNPQLKENATKAPGVVLIDEIDLHLHPKWQWRVIKDLKRVFPKVHFIVTTHSPIIIASNEDNEIIRLYKDDGQIKFDVPKAPFGMLMEDVLTDIMHADSRSPEVQATIERVRQLFLKRLNRALTTEEKAELEELIYFLESHLPEDDPAVILAKMDAIEEELLGSDSDAQS